MFYFVSLVIISFSRIQEVQILQQLNLTENLIILLIKIEINEKIINK